MTPITDCMKVGQSSWARIAFKLFEIIKETLTNALVLALLYFSLTFRIHCDAFKIGIRAVLI